MTRTCLATVATAVVLFAYGLPRPVVAADTPAVSSYKLVREISIGGGGGWDYLSAEPTGHRLYVTHGTKVVVVDTQAGKVAGEIIDTPGVHGFVAVPSLKRGFSSNGQENKASIVDLDTLKTVSKVVTGPNPDAILYDPTSGEVWTFNGRGQSATAFNAKTGEVVTASIPLDGKPETGVVDSAAGKVYVNLEDKSEIAVVDVKTHKVEAHWPIAPGASATGLAFDPELHRLILGCGNSKMVMMDSTNGKVVASIDAGAGIDAAGYDPGTHLAFVSGGGSGTVTIAKVEADKLTPVQTLTTERGARTMTVDTATHHIFLANAKNRTDTTSFKVLEYGMDGTPKP